jgi:hypothetical protein
MHDPAYQPYQSQYPPPPQYPAVGFTCPFCHTTAPPFTASKVSTAGWVVFVLLFLSCFGILLAWIGLLIKEHYQHRRIRLNGNSFENSADPLVLFQDDGRDLYN